MQRTPRELYEADAQEYLAAFDDYLQSFEATEAEHALTYWLTVKATGSHDEGLFRFIVLGFIAASWEQWDEEIGSRRLGVFENLHQKAVRECAELGIPEELVDTIYGSYVMQARIADQAEPGDDTITDRLNLIYDQIVIANTQFETPPTDEFIAGLRTFFDVGVGSNLYVRWEQAMDELGVEESDRWDDLALAPIYEDRLAELDFPTTVRGCTLDQADTFGYELTSPGKLGGSHLTTFLAEGPVANITSIVTSGRLGTRPVKKPEVSHIDALRDLGFEEASFPDGRRYRLSSWGGLSGIRRIKE